MVAAACSDIEAERGDLDSMFPAAVSGGEAMMLDSYIAPACPCIVS
jgi:hypothetical protein